METSIFDINSQQTFNDAAERIFHHQMKENQVYREFVELLEKQKGKLQKQQFPFLPIEMFKRHRVSVSSDSFDIIFQSSGTGNEGTSNHFVKDLNIYHRSFINGFERGYGSISDYTILALLPSYLERTGSSLVYMADCMIRKSNKPQSGFYLNDLEELAIQLKTLNEGNEKILLLGVSFALLDLIDYGPFNLTQSIVMETGGMKGRRKEMTRLELHETLKSGFGVTTIHSEYGMTELLSQAYSQGEGRFKCPPWMQVSIRELNDPFEIVSTGKTGGINIIDLANIHSCSFIATQDLGRMHGDGSFEVLGRYDQSDLRGCNLMVQ